MTANQIYNSLIINGNNLTFQGTPITLWPILQCRANHTYKIKSKIILHVPFISDKNDEEKQY